MVLIWTDLACGDREAAVVLVALNSVFQIVAYSLLGYFYLKILPGWLGLDQAAINASMWQIARAVLIFLGVPLAAGCLTRRWAKRAMVAFGTKKSSCLASGPLHFGVCCSRS